MNFELNAGISSAVFGEDIEHENKRVLNEEKVELKKIRKNGEKVSVYYGDWQHAMEMEGLNKICLNVVLFLPRCSL